MTNNVKIQRAILNLSQSDLATKISVSRQTIHAIETGKYIPSTIIALKIAKLCDLPVENIFHLDEND